MTITFQLREDKRLTGEFIILQPGISEEEFYDFADEDIKCELINGVLVIQSPASSEHEDIFGYLYTLLRQYLAETKEGRVFGSRLAMRLSPSWSPEPDLLVILPTTYSHLKDERLEGPAEIVIEILSKSTREIDLEKKLPAYLKFGIKEVWIIDPEEKTLSIHTQTKTQEWDISQGNEKARSNVLSEFYLQINWLWERDKYNPGHLVRQMLEDV